MTPLVIDFKSFEVFVSLAIVCQYHVWITTHIRTYFIETKVKQNTIATEPSLRIVIKCGYSCGA